jgi:surface protein
MRTCVHPRAYECARAHVCVRVRARMCVCTCEGTCVRIAFVHSAPPSTVAFVGSQAFWSASVFNAAIGAWNTARLNSMTKAFQFASAFNADISAWNTARVTDLYAVCAAFGPARKAADALGRCSMRRGRCARRHCRRCLSRARVCWSRLRGCPRVYV